VLERKITRISINSPIERSLFSRPSS
jgi:hypothetical protein